MSDVPQLHAYDIRDLPADMGREALSVFQALEECHKALTDGHAPVWMHQHLNSMQEDYQRHLDGVRRYQR